MEQVIYHVDLKKFVNTFCVGHQYDSCKNSPCRYSSIHGCKHPEHPKNKEQMD